MKTGTHPGLAELGGDGSLSLFPLRRVSTQVASAPPPSPFTQISIIHNFHVDGVASEDAYSAYGQPS